MSLIGEALSDPPLDGISSMQFQPDGLLLLVGSWDKVTSKRKKEGREGEMISSLFLAGLFAWSFVRQLLVGMNGFRLRLTCIDIY